MGNDNNFDYENSERDVWDNGGDPEYVSHYNSNDRDNYLKDMGLDPDDYSSHSGGGQKSGGSGNGGCYIATAVYGSYDCPQVWTLRRYRDYRLSSKWYGRLFIRVYYAVSPKLVRWFGQKKWFIEMCQKKLDHIVGQLKDEGYGNTPYND